MPSIVVSPAKQILEFLTFTDVPSREADDGEARRIVRSHAIRDANRRKKYNPESRSKKGPSRVMGAPLPQKNFTSKFRVEQKPKGGVKTNIQVVENEDLEVEVDSKLEVLSARMKTLSKRPRINEIPRMPGPARFDPFNTLPVTIGSSQQALLEYRSFLFHIVFPNQAHHIFHID